MHEKCVVEKPLSKNSPIIIEDDCTEAPSKGLTRRRPNKERLRLRKTRKLPFERELASKPPETLQQWWQAQRKKTGGFDEPDLNTNAQEVTSLEEDSEENTNDPSSVTVSNEDAKEGSSESSSNSSSNEDDSSSNDDESSSNDDDDSS